MRSPVCWLQDGPEGQYIELVRAWAAVGPRKMGQESLPPLPPETPPTLSSCTLFYDPVQHRIQTLTEASPCSV